MHQHDVNHEIKETLKAIVSSQVEMQELLNQLTASNKTITEFMGAVNKLFDSIEERLSAIEEQQRSIILDQHSDS